jgi:hypothetical protein
MRCLATTGLRSWSERYAGAISEAEIVRSELADGMGWRRWYIQGNRTCVPFVQCTTPGLRCKGETNGPALRYSERPRARRGVPPNFAARQSAHTRACGRPAFVGWPTRQPVGPHAGAQAVRGRAGVCCQTPPRASGLAQQHVPRCRVSSGTARACRHALRSSHICLPCTAWHPVAPRTRHICSAYRHNRERRAGARCWDPLGRFFRKRKWKVAGRGCQPGSGRQTGLCLPIRHLRSSLTNGLKSLVRGTRIQLAEGLHCSGRSVESAARQPSLGGKPAKWPHL